MAAPINPLLFQYQLRADAIDKLPMTARIAAYEQRDRELEDFLGRLFIAGGGGSGGSLVLDPAYAGPRRDLPFDQALFGHVDHGGCVGFSVTPVGVLQIISGKGLSTGFYEAQGPLGAPTTYNLIGRVYAGAEAGGILEMGGMSMGDHPTHAWPWRGIWPTNLTAQGQYALLTDGSTTLLNASSLVRLRVNNNDCATFSPTDGVTANVAVRSPYVHTWATNPAAGGFAFTADNGGYRAAQQFETHRQSAGGWETAGFMHYQAGAQACMSLHSPGIAPMVRARQDTGDRIGIVNNQNNAYTGITASSFDVSSTATVKRGIRTLCTRERIVVRRPVDADVVAEPDIMSLRPVAFRPKIPMLRIVPTDPSGDYETVDPQDTATWRSEPWGMDTVLGRESTRERLGLIAEDVATVIPSAVSHDIHGNAMGIDYAQITVALLHHVQQLTDEVSTLRYRVAELEGPTP